MERASLLLWMPLSFYVYSVAYGSVPIFIPQLWPHSYYNSRYGMELLPALAVFACVALAALERRLTLRREMTVVEQLRELAGAACVCCGDGACGAESAGDDLRHAVVQTVAAQIEHHPATAGELQSAAGAEGGARERDDAGAV